MPSEVPHPDLLFPSEERARDIARELYAGVMNLPVVSVHSHIDAAVLRRNEPFADPAALLVTPDHYVLRLLHASGEDLAALGREPLDGSAAPVASRQIWRSLCRHWPAFRGTNSRLWLELELARLFGVTDPLSDATADATYDAINARLAEDPYRPRALFEAFGLEVLATTDPALSSLEDHRALAEDASFAGTVIPTLRPDNVLDATRLEWARNVEALGREHDMDCGSWQGYLEALRCERRRFAEHGAVSTDHGPADAETLSMSDREAGRLFEGVLSGDCATADRGRLSAHLLVKMAELSCDDGLVMQLHPGVLRDHDTAARARFGPDIGADFPVAVDFARGLRPLLERCGSHPGFTLVVYTVDEVAFARELAPMASYYPGLRLGAPWWWLDAPDAMSRWLGHMAEVAGFGRSAGFVDDARSFCSIQARHEVARRTICGYLARLVAEYRLDGDEAVEVAADLAYRLPKATFGL